jgi:methylmalonyl-CoA mutase N-terminal domain/subunit
MNGAFWQHRSSLAKGSVFHGKPEALSGTIQNDILKEFMVRNTQLSSTSVDARHRGHYRVRSAAHASVLPSRSRSYRESR